MSCLCKKYARRPPNSCAAKYTGTLDMVTDPLRNDTMVTTGLMWPPDKDPTMLMAARNAAVITKGLPEKRIAETSMNVPMSSPAKIPS